MSVRWYGWNNVYYVGGNVMTKDELIALIHSALKPTKIDCERLTDFEQDNDEIVIRFFGLEEEEDE